MTNKILILLLFSLKIYGQNNFDIREIRNIDLSGINSVIRFSDTQITIESNKSFTVKKHWAVTVFNEASEADYASLKVYYDKFSTVKKIEGTIYDGEGKELKKLRNADVKDFATSSYGDDVTDNRVKYAEFNKKFYPYPYTVEFEYEERSSNMLFIPTWFPVEADQTFLQNAKLHLIYPSDFALRLKEVNMLQKSEKLNINNKNEEVWNLKNYKTPVSEPYSRQMMYPYIVFSASNFVVEDYSGSGKTWQDLSLFYHNLNKDRGKVPANLESEIQKMLAGINSKEEKVKKIYEYIQTHTRYQSIQLGIGGWQTRLAMEVAEKGYGDCKALTNFAISLLKLANITAYPVLIKAGDDQLLQDTDISRMTFNHVIACVPIEKDTIWLECTSQDNPFGYQGDFTGNRKGLLIKPENGGLINTIQYRPEHNLIQRSANISVSESGDANIKVNTKYTGIQHEYRANVYKTKSPQEQIDWLTARYTIPNIQIVAHTNKLNKLKIPELN